MLPHEYTHGAGENIPDTPAHLQRGSRTAAEQGKCCEHLQVFDYVTSPHGNGVVIRIWRDRVGIIVDATHEVEYFERPEDIGQIQPITFFPTASHSGEQHDIASQEDEYQYLDPHVWPYNDPHMTDEYLVMCGFPTREAAGYPFPTKPEHVERLREATLVSTPQEKGKLWRNWDTQFGVILEGTQRVTCFSKPEEWTQIVLLEMVSPGGDER
jgi:hypothetical protein